MSPLTQTRNEDGSYNLIIPGEAVNVKNAIIVKGSKFIYDGTNTKIPVLEVTADTIFLYQNHVAPNATYTSVTGYENVPATLIATDIQYIVKGGKVASVKVVKHGETAMLVGAAEKKLAKQIVANNGTEGVNAVTGASNSSKGIIAAVNQALAKAK